MCSWRSLHISDILDDFGQEQRPEEDKIQTLVTSIVSGAYLPLAVDADQSHPGTAWGL